MHDHDDKQSSLATQLREYATGQRSSVFCPWCGGANGVGIKPCCKQFVHSKERVGYENMDSVVRQMQAISIGATRVLECPYCGVKNHAAQWSRPDVSPFCCDALVAAVIARAERMKVDEAIELKKRIEDNLADGRTGVRDERVAAELKRQLHGQDRIPEMEQAVVQ